MVDPLAAPMDLYVAVALGCDRASALAGHLGKEEEAGRYKAGIEFTLPRCEAFL